MEFGMESTDRGDVTVDFVAVDGGDGDSTPRLPPRLRRRLTEVKSSPPSAEEIETKLRDAELRRQKFYENLSTKARPKQRSFQQSDHEVDLGQRLEAKLQAAEQKRSSILAKAQLRLAKLDESRQAAKLGLEERLRKECAELGTKVEYRVQQAELNRMLILKARQRRAMVKERISQSLYRRIARESKYKERVRAAIYQKRTAAEKKRLGLLEADKNKARARLSQVRKVARSVYQQRENERRRLRENLEHKLQRAKRQRAEYLMMRAGLNHPVGVNWNKQMQMQGEILSRKLARCWKTFQRQKTTLDLANTYNDLTINARNLKSMPFEHLALLIESSNTLHTTKALLDRLDLRYNLLLAFGPASSSHADNDISHLLTRVVSPKKGTSTTRSSKWSETVKTVSDPEKGKAPVHLSRYQVRVVLCAYMIMGHPDAVFSGRGEREIALADSAEKFVSEFELLIKIILDGPQLRSDETSDSVLPKRCTFRSQLATFDAAWCSYLNSFVVWKVKDAKSLEDDLIRAACQLEISMMQKCKLTREGDVEALPHDLKAIHEQVSKDQKLLKEKVMHLSGDAGIERLQNSICNVRMKYFQATEDGSVVGSPPTAHFLLPTFPPVHYVSGLDKRSDEGEGGERPSRVVRPLFNNYASPVVSLEEAGTFVPGNHIENQFNYSGEYLEMENEFIVNEFVHEPHNSFADASVVSTGDRTVIKVKETIEKAFWDGITEALKQDEYERVVALMREVRDELCKMAPQSWKEEITEAIDLDILSQLLNSGSLDMEYLGRILEFALVSLQKLSAAANESKLKESHKKLLNELAEMCQAENGSKQSHVIALIKGLRFVLEQIQVLKKEISKARIRIMEPLLKGPAGLEYLRKAFAKHYGPPSDAGSRLSLTTQWLLSVVPNTDHEWSEHTRALSDLNRVEEGSSKRLLPSTALRTGGSFSMRSGLQSPPPLDSSGGDLQYPECKGEKTDLMVRIGLLKLVNEVYGLTQEELPETLKLNFLRLRAVQAQLQKITVTATGILVLRQTLLSEQLVGNSEDMERLVLKCVTEIFEILDTVEDAGIEEIVGTLGKIVEGCDKSGDSTKLLSRKNVMSSMLRKSVQAGDPVFVMVSRAIYLAARGVVLSGTGIQGRKLAEMALRLVGAAVLTDRLEEAVKVLVVAAAVTVGIHGPWYATLIGNM